MGDMGGYATSAAARAGGREERTAEAARALGLTLPATAKEVRAAYVAAVKAAHPDSGGAGGDIAALKEARNILEAAITPLNHETKIPVHTPAMPCPMCHGSGSVVVGFAAGACAMCGGKGKL